MASRLKGVKLCVLLSSPLNALVTQYEIAAMEVSWGEMNDALPATEMPVSHQ